MGHRYSRIYTDKEKEEWILILKKIIGQDPPAMREKPAYRTTMHIWLRVAKNLAMRKGMSGQVSRIVWIMRPSAEMPLAAGEKNLYPVKSLIYER